MKRKLGSVLIWLGVLMILSAAGLLLYNRQEADRAVSFSARVLPELSAYAEAAAASASAPPLVTDPLGKPREMTLAEIDGRGYVGILCIPSIGYEVPVLADYSEALLMLGACRFHGSAYGCDLVICAHNYNRLYARLTQLHAGDAVWFTDMDGLCWTYEVSDLETLGPNMVAEMNRSGFDLTFFTCTYGGQSRLTLRCVRTQESFGD